MAHTCSISSEGERLIWNVERLWELARDLPIEPVPLAAVSHLLENSTFSADDTSFMEIVRQARRIYQADLSQPIILSAEGLLMDGLHRIAKAWMLGLEEIQVVRFPANPEPDRREARQG